MARFDKSDDSGDSDYEPRQNSGKKKKSNLKIATPASRRPSVTSASTHHASPTAGVAPSHFSSFLPTPDPTPTDLAFAAQQIALKSPIVVTDSDIYAPLPKGPAYCLDGMLQYDDEVLNGQLSFSRRGMLGHCSRDTADLWFYILSLFYPREEGYHFNVANYVEQAPDDGLTIVPAGTAVTIQVLRQQMHFDPYHRCWSLTSTTPVLTILCASTETCFAEYPSIRHKVESSQDLHASTPLQKALYDQLSQLLQAHNDSVAAGVNGANQLRSINGAVACGTMVRFFKVRAGNAGDGWLRTWSARGLDLVSGNPSASLGFVERILLRIKDPAMKGNLGRL